MAEGDQTVKSRSQNKSILTQNPQSTVPQLNLNQSHVKKTEVREPTPTPATPQNENYKRRASEYHTARKVVNISNLIKEKEKEQLSQSEDKQARK
jgi:hypothetical protein